MKYIYSILLLMSLNTKAQLYFPPSGTSWDTLSPASLGWCDDKIDTLIDYLGNRNTKAFILLKDGKIVIEHYYGTFTKDSIWYWASAGKSLTGFMVGIAQQEGFLSINDSTSKYLGAGWSICPPVKEGMITIRNQLTMTSGLDDGVPDNSCTLDSCLVYLADAGTRWAYHNAPYTLLDSVMVSATGQSLNSYVLQKLSLPTGMTGLYVPIDYDHVFFSTARSMARFGLLILNKGTWDTTPVLTDTIYYNDMVNTSQLLNPSYGYLWWLNGKASYMVPGLQLSFPGSLNTSAPSDMFGAFGKNGQMINVVPSMNLVYIRMGDSPGTSGAVPVTFNDTIWQKLNDVFCNSTFLDVRKNENLLIYPVPASDIVKVKLPEQSFIIFIYDNTGRLLFQKPAFDNTDIPLEHLIPGNYFITAVSKDNIYNRRFVKQ